MTLGKTVLLNLNKNTYQKKVLLIGVHLVSGSFLVSQFGCKSVVFISMYFIWGSMVNG